MTDHETDSTKDHGLTTKSVFARAAMVLVLACLGMAAIGYAVAVWVVRPWVDPKVYGLVIAGNVVHDPDSLRFAFPVEVNSVSHTRGLLRALGPRVALGTRLDVLVYDFAVGGMPRQVYSTPVDRRIGEGLAGWGKDGIHFLYGDRHGYRHVVIDPDLGTVTVIPRARSHAMADSMTRIQYALEREPDYREIKTRGLQWFVKDPTTGQLRLLFEYSNDYAGIPLDRMFQEDTNQPVGH
jgi:hypothetical protein